LNAEKRINELSCGIEPYQDRKEVNFNNPLL